MISYEYDERKELLKKEYEHRLFLLNVEFADSNASNIAIGDTLVLLNGEKAIVEIFITDCTQPYPVRIYRSKVNGKDFDVWPSSIKEVIKKGN